MERPTVTVSYAQTLDGRLATRTGSSKWISGAEALCFAHELRASHDAIMVGVGTVLCDNPRLTVRHVAGPDPTRVIVDSRLSTPLTAAVLDAGAARGTILAVSEHAPADRCAAIEALGATLLQVESGANGWIQLSSLLAALHARGVRSLMVEGGARLITSFMREKLVDRLAICVAPKILGTGIEAIGDLSIDDLDHAVQLVEPTVTRYGADIVIDGRVAYAPGVDGR
jgi:5-amino-6-(5-phosphoribosylamino)uracil reductase/diaminohydroxyphosphoribosylaminopyrimidine deaminase/5-amino-6-(5-phosphoribosylamino)uracil reductase